MSLLFKRHQTSNPLDPQSRTKDDDEEDDDDENEIDTLNDTNPGLSFLAPSHDWR
jgi:hypothetical protein